MCSKYLPYGEVRAAQVIVDGSVASVPLFTEQPDHASYSTSENKDRVLMSICTRNTFAGGDQRLCTTLVLE